MRRYMRTADTRRKLENGKRNLDYTRSKRNKATSRLAGNALNLHRQIVVFVYCQWCTLDLEEGSIERKKGYAETSYTRESWESFDFFDRGKVGADGENGGWRLASGSSWIGWRKKNDDGKDLCDVKRYKKKNLTCYIKNDSTYDRIFSPAEIYMHYREKNLENWKKNIYIYKPKNLLTFIFMYCIFDVNSYNCSTRVRVTPLRAQWKFA